MKNCWWHIGYLDWLAADAAKGKKIYTKCKACHNADAEKNKIGPHLVKIVGRKAGSVESYKKYSDDLKGAGIVWNEANLNKWLVQVLQGFKYFNSLPNCSGFNIFFVSQLYISETR